MIDGEDHLLGQTLGGNENKGKMEVFRKLYTSKPFTLLKTEDNSKLL
jgi:hypothetical protein